MINNISSMPTYSQVPETSVKRPEGFQGSSADVFVHDQEHDLEAEQSFREAGQLFMSKKHKHKQKNPTNGTPGAPDAPGRTDSPRSGRCQNPEEIYQVGDELFCKFPNREGYKSDFLGIDYPLPELGDSIKGSVSHLIDNPDETVLDYTHFSIVMNKDRKQPFFTAVNIDGTQSQSIRRSGDWVIDGRIPREDQLGDEAYAANSIDRGHMVRRKDPAWGNEAALGSGDTFVYTNSGLQCSALNQKEWLALEDHVLASAQGQKMTVLTGPVFSENDRSFTNHGAIDKPTQIPEKFWKMVVWNDPQTKQLKGAAFVLSQSDILDKSDDLFKGKKGGFKPDRFDVYQVPISQLQEMTDLKFAPCKDITPGNGVMLTSADEYRPQGL